MHFKRRVSPYYRFGDNGHTSFCYTNNGSSQAYLLAWWWCHEENEQTAESWSHSWDFGPQSVFPQSSFHLAYYSVAKVTILSQYLIYMYTINEDDIERNIMS